MFTIGAQNRAYDLHRPKGCTVLTIEVDAWPGNEFGLWLPETVLAGGKIVWCNWRGDPLQDWEQRDGAWVWSKEFGPFRLTSALTVDPARSCLWYVHTFVNESPSALSGLNCQTCFHLVNAPQFISVRGERIWACLDGEWTTTDKVPRAESPDPRRVKFLKAGIRTERTVIPDSVFPSATMPEQASHPLIVAERFGGDAAVGIACRNVRHLFNNNDSILRCIHSEPFPVEDLPPGAEARQEGVIIFLAGGHQDVLSHFDAITDGGWR
ncbi:MAG: hypothetical protein JXR37_36375 [Kiritimatiellae bacterium]|nr:hypothetical protein [Kiritimatiellia bacterium]